MNVTGSSKRKCEKSEKINHVEQKDMMKESSFLSFQRYRRIEKNIVTPNQSL